MKRLARALLRQLNERKTGEYAELKHQLHTFIQLEDGEEEQEDA